MTGKQKLSILAGVSLAMLVVGLVWFNDEATYVGGLLLGLGFIGSILSAVSYRKKMKD
jgi:hypothetical protein